MYMYMCTCIGTPINMCTYIVHVLTHSSLLALLPLPLLLLVLLNIDTFKYALCGQNTEGIILYGCVHIYASLITTCIFTC